MKTKNTSRQSYVTHTTKLAWVAAATVIVTLILGAFAGIPSVEAGGDSIQRGIDADTARYQALGTFYLAQAAAGRERAAEADSARWLALGRSYIQGSAELPYNDVSKNDVSKFYAERMRAQASSNELAANPELMIARRSYGPISRTLAANPELMVAHRYHGQRSVTCSASHEQLATNPELMVFRRTFGC